MELKLDTLTYVWHRQAQGEGPHYFFIATDRNSNGNKEWVEHPIKFTNPDQVYNRLTELAEKFPPQEWGWHWNPTPFRRPRRLKKNALPGSVLWADLDRSIKKVWEPGIEPTLLWESSPGNFQCLWFLDKSLPPKKLEELNHKMTLYTEADTGGWNITHTFRVPGSINHKYRAKPQVKVHYDALQKAKATVSGLWEKFKKIVLRQDGDFAAVSDELPHPADVMKKWRKRIPAHIIKLLLQKEEPDKGNRSEVLWKIENSLRETGLGVSEIVSLVRNTVWNKYRGRSDETRRLKRDIENLLGHQQEKKKKRKVQIDEDVEIDEVEARDLRVESYSEVMSNLTSSPGWMVDQIWTRGSYGLVAGDPKSFKTTMCLELAVSIASGRPFLGKYAVHEQGTVLIIQNENSPWIIKDRFEKITGRRGLSGKVYRTRMGEILIRWPKDLPIKFINQQSICLDNDLDKLAIEAILKKIKPKMLVLDPFYLMMNGDINSVQELKPVLDWLIEINREYKCAIQLVHHQKKSKTGARPGSNVLGSVALHGWVESAWYIASGAATEKKTLEVGEDKPTRDLQVKIAITREFRGGPVLAPLRIGVNMGGMGTKDYDCSILEDWEEEEEEKPKRKWRKVPKDDLEDEL